MVPPHRQPSAGWTLSASLRACVHPSAVCPQKSDTAGQEGCSPCVGIWL